MVLNGPSIDFLKFRSHHKNVLLMYDLCFHTYFGKFNTFSHFLFPCDIPVETINTSILYVYV